MKASYHAALPAAEIEGYSNQLVTGHRPFDTGPPKEDSLPAFAGFKAAISHRLSDVMMPVVARFARDHVGGETVEDAMAVARRLAGQGTPCTLGFWDSSAYTQRSVADIYLATIKYLGSSGVEGYASLKPPALRFSSEIAVELALAAEASGVRLHCDSHGPEVVDLSNGMLEAMLTKVSAKHLGTTIPGRWSRSLSDADWAVERGLAVRVVKGQWPDPANPGADMRAGYLEVIKRLAGRAPHVAVATHDMSLAAESVAILRAAGTPCELEQLFGSASRQSTQWAKENNIRLRIYIPFGKGFIPNAMRVLRRNPRLALTIAKKMVTARFEG